ncbi:hypothetical protein ABW19_dt0204768 [Dactylella cylindrospora]|nr:hypothetical protein ABW19_dt0204768 [Dactylella cylindrospora]
MSITHVSGRLISRLRVDTALKQGHRTHASIHNSILFVRTMASRGKRKAREETPEKEDRVSPPPTKRPTTSNASATISSFFTPTSKKAPPPKFVEHGSLIVSSWSPLPSAATTTAASTIETATTADGTSQTVATTIVATDNPVLQNGSAKSKPLRIAAFDLDSTLIVTKSGKKFAKEAGDWKWWNPAVPIKLRQLHADG